MVLQTLLTRDHIRDIYRERVATQENEKRDEGRRYLHQHHVVTYLSIMEHSQKFSRQITDTLDASVRNNEDWHPSDAANAFLALEKYALNLLDYPWKTEFKTLKLCGGFYQAQISPQLRQAMYIFMLMGYEKASEDILVLKQQSSSYDTLVYVACECFLAAVECFMMKQIWEKVDESRFLILDVYKSRMEMCGDVDGCATWVVQHCVAQARRVPPMEPRSLNYNSFNSYHHNYIRGGATGAKPKTNVNSNSDHHTNSEILRSKKSSKGSASPTQTKKSRDSGYGSKASSELPDIAPGRVIRTGGGGGEEITPEDLYGHGAQACDNSIAQLSMERHELHLRDARTGARLQTDSDGRSAGGAARHHTDGATSDSSADDLFVAKSIDDHIKQSEKYLKEKEPRGSGAAGASPLSAGESGPYDEWSDVRDKLRQDFGDKYFEGERGDTILKPQSDGGSNTVPPPPPPPVSVLRDQQQEKEKRKTTERKSFQNVDVIRADLSTRHSKVEFGTADKYKGPMVAVAERANQVAAGKPPGTLPSEGGKDSNSKPPVPGILKQNSAEEQKRFDNAAMVKSIVEQSSVFRKLAAERSPSEESLGRKDRESVKSKDVSPTESVHSTVGELIDFSEAKVLHQMGCKFMPELRARPQGKPQLTPEEKAERKKRKEERKKERERREKEKESKAEEAVGGTEKLDDVKPVKEGNVEVAPSNGKPDSTSGSGVEKTDDNKPTSTPVTEAPGPSTSATETTPSGRTTASHAKEPKRQAPPVPGECGEHGCDKNGKIPKQPIVKKEILTNDVISNAQVMPPGGGGGSNAQPRDQQSPPREPRAGAGADPLMLNGTAGPDRGSKVAGTGSGCCGPNTGPPGGSPVHSAAIKGTCIAGHAALTNNTISSHAMGGSCVGGGGAHSPRCPVHGTPGVPHPLIAINHPHIPQGHHIVMCTAGHAHIAPAHMAAMSVAQPQYAVTTGGPKEVPCPKPPPPPVAPKPNIKGAADGRRGLDLVASTSSGRQPPTPPPRVSSALSDASSELPPPPPELLSDIHAPPPDLVSNHTPPPSHARSPSHASPGAAAPATKALGPGGAQHLPTEPPSYEAATGIAPGSGRRDGPYLVDDADGLYVVADGPPPMRQPQTWQCKVCTFANDASKKICGMCHKSRLAGPEAQPLLSGGSQCPRCTYVNSIGSLMCKVCMQDLQGSPTYI